MANEPRYPTTAMCDGRMLEMFEPTVRDTDVFVATAAKCGQTWLQTLLHHLRTCGRDPSFGGKGLGGVSPWLELPGTARFGHRIEDRDERLATFEALPDPRVFKMHVVWEEIPRPRGSKAKVMTITRDPRDVPWSMFSHLHAIEHEDGDGPPADFDAYFERWMELGLYFRIVGSFWPHRDAPDLLWLRYEDLQRDLRGEAKRILDFLGWDRSDEDIDRALPLARFEHMQATEKTDIMVGGKSVFREDRNFFREGGVGKNRERLSAEQERRIVERTRRDLGDECAGFVLTLDR